VQFEKYPYSPQGSLTEIPRGKGVSKAQFFKGKYEAKLNFWRDGGGGFELNNLLWGYEYFLEQHNQSFLQQKTEKMFQVTDKAAALQPHKQNSEQIYYFEVVFLLK